MENLVLFSFLVGRKNYLASIIIHDHGTRFRFCKSLCLDLAKIHERKRKAIGEKRPEFLHNIQCKARSSRPVGVKESDLRIKTDGLKRRRHIMSEQDIYEGKKCIHVVHGRSPVPSMKKEIVLLGGDEVIKRAEIDACGFALSGTESFQRKGSS